MQDVVVVLRHHRAGVEQHANGLDGVERNPLGALDDAGDRLFREPGHQAVQQLRHLGRDQRLEVDARHAAHRAAPVRPPLEQLRSSERHDEDGRRAGPGQQVLHEVEQALVGPVQIDEDEHRRRLRRDPLEQGAPGGEQLLAAVARQLGQAQQAGQPRLDEAALLGVVQELLQHGGQLRPGGGSILSLGDLRPQPHHLGQRPVADPLPVGRRAALVPVRRLDHAVQVLLELPGEPGLADAGLPDDRHQPRLALSAGGVEQVLQLLQLVLAAHERRLQRAGPAAAAAARDHGDRSPGRDRRGLALEHPLPRRLVADGIAGGPIGGLAHQHGARLRHRLQSAGGVDHVAGDHALALGADGHGRLTGEHRRAGVERLVAVRDGADARHERQGGADRALGVVLVGSGRSPDRHHRVADELLDRPAVPLHDPPRHLEVAGQQLARLLRVAILGGRS